ncbi:MAG: hypothetical protein ABSG25_06875, partial [Bryobacteraceae bacterium]
MTDLLKLAQLRKAYNPAAFSALTKAAGAMEPATGEAIALLEAIEKELQQGSEGQAGAAGCIT